jgi:hypothetical protein
MRGALPALLVLFQALPPALHQVLPPAGSLEVEALGAQVSVRAHAVPVNRILDRLAQQTGMKVTYESSPPSQQVTATLERLPVREAVVRLMEGLGVGYVFSTDASGQRVETLIVTGTAAADSTTSSVASQSSPMDYQAEVVQEVPEYEPPPEPVQAEMPPPQPGMPANDLAMPGMPTYQGIPTYQGGASGAVTAPGYTPSYPKIPQYPGTISQPN